MGNMLSCKTTSDFYHRNGNDERRLLDLHIGLHNFLTTKPPAPSHYHKPIHQPTTLSLQSWMGDIIIHMKSASDDLMIGAKMENDNYDTKIVCEYLIHNQIQGGNCHPRIVCEKIMVNDQIEVVKKLICMPPASHACQTKPISENTVENHGFEDLPEDVLCTIFSKLPLKEIVRTSVLSSKWRNLWTICPSLRLDGDVLCGQYDSKLLAPPFLTRQQYIQKFINIVNAILRQHRGKPIEELVVKFGIHAMLHRHLDNWISCAISSWTKKLTIDLDPASVSPMRYEMPIGLFDIECASRLQIIELGYVIFIPPPHFTGFPNLTKLDLTVVHSTAKAIRDMVSHCHNLEWLGFERCLIGGELIVDQPLSRLEYLKVKSCTATKVEFHAMKLRDFIYRPHIVPIDIRDSLELENVDVSFACMDVEYAVTVLPSQFPTVQSLTFSVSTMPLKFSRPFESSFKFLKLRILKLGFFITDDVNDNMIFLSSFLMAAPIIEELEMALFWRSPMYVGDGPFRSLSVRPYNYLKRLHVEGFTGSKGEFEFVLNTTENAPALEVLSIDPKGYDYVARNAPSRLEMIRENAKRVFDGKIPPKTTFHLL